MNETQQHNPAATAADEALEHLPRVEQVVKSLVKVVGGRKLYADNNPRLAQFVDELRAALGRFFEAEDELVLAVEQYRILWRGESVYANEKREESLAFLLYKDGVGEVTLRPHVLDHEIDAFVHIIAQESVSATRSDEDVVTQLWNADFDHISYRVMDDYLAADPAEAADENSLAEIADQAELLPSLEDKGRVIVRPTDELESIDGYLHRLIMEDCESADDNEQEAHFQEKVESFFARDPADVERYLAEREAELRDDGLVAFADAIFVFTLLQDNPSAVRDVSGVLERIVDFVVADRDPRALSRTLALVRGFRTGQPLPENVAALCDRLEGELTTPTLVQSFERELEHWNGGTEDVLAYFECIGAPVVDPLLKVLHRVDGGRLHREICNVLIRAAGADIESVLDRMDIDNPRVANDAVYIARSIDIRTLTPRVQELLYYPDARVKGEMVELVARLDDPSVPDLLLASAADADKEVRCKALQTAASRGFPQVARYLGELAFSKELQERDPDEQEAVFRALGHVGDAMTVEHLRKFAARRRLLDFSGNRDHKVLAIRALEHIQEPSAVDMLQELSRDSSEVVRTRAGRALAALRSRMRHSGGGEES